MAKRCDVCKKGSTRGASRSHSNVKTLKRQDLNLQAKTIDGKKMKVCVGCIRTLKKRVSEVEAKMKAAVKPKAKTKAKAKK